MVKSPSPIPPLTDTPRELTPREEKANPHLLPETEGNWRGAMRMGARNVGGQREWGAIRAVQSHVGNREDVWAVLLLPCTPSVLGGQNHGGKSMGRKTLL